jgi:phosphoglycolate phosphatase
MLVLFDIDGTLLSAASGAHRDALLAALRDVHRIDAEVSDRPLSPAGRTDGEIARAILLGAGVSALRIDERAEAVREACCRVYAQLCPADMSDRLVPGITGVLEWLGGRSDVTLALLTGNYEPVARLKLGRAGVGHYFQPDQGAFGSDAEDRVALPPIARRRAGNNGVSHPRERTLVIGDTPRDIACARADGLRCVAVTTGPFARPELTDADAVAGDAAELRGALEAILG